MNMKGFEAKKIAFTAIAAALLVAVKYALSAIAGFELVTLLLLVYAAALGLPAALMAFAVMLAVDIAHFGFMPWVIMYLLHFPLVCVAGYFLNRVKANEYIVASVAALLTVIFSFQSTYIEHLFYGYPFWVRFGTGAIVFILNTCTNFITALILYKPLVRAIKRVIKTEEG